MKRAKLFHIFLVVFVIAGTYAIVFFAERFFYPLSPFKEQIIKTADRYGIQRTMLFAIIKTESGFNEKAVSEKGAMGLMQLTKNTADYVAELKNVSEYDIFDAETNLDFGCYYLNYLEKKFSDKDVCLAAYNAGEGNVKKWLSDKRYSSDGKTLSAIPLAETAEYVKKVNKSLSKYKKLYFNLLDKR